MLGKRPRPMIGKLSELLVSGSRAVFPDAVTSPRSPLEFKMQSPRGLKTYDVGGVGLGIVAALEKSGESRYAICCSNLTKSSAIPINYGKRVGCGDLGVESSEDYTYVTCHGPCKSMTKVYYDGGEQRRVGQDRYGPNRGIKKLGTVQGDSSVYPTSDFLSSCHLCRKKLHGKDIYMYRGEKAFCSTECRSRQIMMDESKEQCRSEASRSAKFSSSPYKTDQIFSTGILAI